MSVVNKMLQDLEARQESESKLSADYQAPQTSIKIKWLKLVLLSFAIVGLGYALIARIYSPVFNHDTGLPQAVPINAMIPTPFIKKMRVDEKKSENEQSLANNTPASALAFTPPVIHNVVPTATLITDTNPIESVAFGLKDNDEIKTETQQKEALSSNVSNQLDDLPVKSNDSQFSVKGSSEADQVDSLRERIKNALANHQEPLAIELLSELHRLEPNNMRLIKKLASLLFANNNITSAKTLLLSSITNSSYDTTDLRLMLARIYQQQEAYETSWELLNVFEPAPHIQIEYWAYRANLAQQLTHYLAAKKDYLALINVDANNAKWHLGLAVTEDRLGNVSLALGAYRKALALDRFEGQVQTFVEKRIVILAGDS